MNYCQNQPQKPLERVNGYNIKVEIQSNAGLAMSELGFACEFWIDGAGRKVIIGRENMKEIVRNGKKEYYAQFYSTELGNAEGWLMATVAIQQPDDSWDCGFRSVTLTDLFTGHYLGKKCMGIPRVPRCYCSGQHWQDGFKVFFSKVDNVPQSEENPNEPNPDNPNTPDEPTVSDIFKYGVVTSNNITSLLEITELMVSGFVQAKGEQTIEVELSEGNKVVVLIPESSSLKAKKTDGFGNASVFDGYLAVNGDIIILNGESYKVYGEMSLADGTMIIDVK